MKRLLLTLFSVFLLVAPAHAGNLASANNQPASNTAAVATLSANTNLAIEGVMCHWSYNGTPTSGKVTIKAGSTTISEVDITAGGPGFLPLDGFVAGPNTTLSATLAAGGSGITGKVSISGRYGN